MPDRTLVALSDTRAALPALAAAFHDFPARKLTVVGITGTDGKSTTCYLTVAMLEAARYRTGLIGGVQFKIGDEWRMNTLTETSPEADLTQGLLAEMVAAGCTHAVVESTSHGLALHRLDHCEFDIGVFTGLSDDHLDFHGTRAEYLDAKLNLFRFLDSARDKGVAKRAVVRVDDAHRAAVAAATRAETRDRRPKRPGRAARRHLHFRPRPARRRIPLPPRHAGRGARPRSGVAGPFQPRQRRSRGGRRLRAGSWGPSPCSEACATWPGCPGAWSGSMPGSPSASWSTRPPPATPSAVSWAPCDRSCRAG